MHTCLDTGLAIPECSCPRCLERQLDQFAPPKFRVYTTRSHNSLRLSEVRSRGLLPPIS